MKFKHPMHDDFLNENALALMKLEELAKKAIFLYNTFRKKKEDKDYGGNYRNNITDPEFSGKLFVNTINVINNTPDIYLYTIDPNQPKRLIHFYGNYKIGDRSRMQLAEDVENSMSMITTDENKTLSFDLDKHIQITQRILPQTRGIESTFIEDDAHMILFDVNMLLIRMISNPTMAGLSISNDSLEDGIVTCMFNKLLMFNFLKPKLSRMISNIVMHHKKGDREYFDYKNIANCLYAYKLWYNSVNCLDCLDLDKTMENTMDLIDNMSRTFNATQAVHDSYSIIHDKIINEHMDKLRHVDSKLKKFMNEYNLRAQNYIHNYCTKRSQSIKNHKYGINVSYGIESINALPLLTSLGYQIEPSNNKALFDIIGAESLAPGDKHFEAYKKTTRINILKELTPAERKVYTNCENDVIRLKSDSIACNSEVSKGTILKRAEALGKIILIEINKTKNEELVTLLSLLDNERIEIQTDLANRDIAKERNSMLYGMQITKNNWNY